MKLLPVLCCALLALSIQAQTVQRQAKVYRCGPEGRDLRDSPCPDGSGARSIGFDEPSAAAGRAGEARARHQRAQGAGPQSLPPPAQAASGPQVVSLQPRKPHGAASAGR